MLNRDIVKVYLENSNEVWRKPMKFQKRKIRVGFMPPEANAFG
jgi:hypothetical protein